MRLTTARKSFILSCKTPSFSHKKGIKKPPIYPPPTSLFAVKLSSFQSWLRHQLHILCYLNMRKRKSRRTPVNVIYLLVFADFLYAKKNHQRSPKNHLTWSLSENSGFFTLSVFAYTNKTRRRNPLCSFFCGSLGWMRKDKSIRRGVRLRRPSHKGYITTIQFYSNVFLCGNSIS